MYEEWCKRVTGRDRDRHGLKKELLRSCVGVGERAM